MMRILILIGCLMSLVPMADAQSVGQIKPKTNAGTVATPKPVAPPVALTNPVEIDEKLSTCLQVNGSTAGMIRCLEEAYRSWDQLMNNAFLVLQNELNADHKAQLRRTQNQWIAYREAENNWITNFYPKDGTLWVTVRMQERVDLVKARALQLKGYVDTLHEN